MHDTSRLRLVRSKRGYRLETNAEPPALVGVLVHVHDSRGEGWRYWPHASGGLWPTAAAALEARRVVPADWVRAAIAAADAGG